MTDPNVKTNLKPLKQYAERIRRGLESHSGPMMDAMKQWGKRYRSFVKLRFDRYSKGGGDWAPLKPSTIAGRRKGKAKKVKKIRTATTTGKADRRFKKPTVAVVGGVSIFRDTGTLMAALEPTLGKPGQLQRNIPYGIRVGYGGPHKHKGKGTTVTIADIAMFHQEGKGHAPKREIIVDPDQQTIAGMEQDVLRALKRMGG